MPVLKKKSIVHRDKKDKNNVNSIFIGSNFVPMNFFLTGPNLNMTTMGKLERVVGGLMNPRSGEHSTA